ncbi:MAG: hypothetical protein M4579_003715 [Chaenotheca gracillima]|nr:MAG: hypothetical protein M4579_003715 [Chaenotheca gracillima]
MKTTQILAFALPLFAGLAQATHKIGDPCTTEKFFNTLGCSNDQCSVVKCIPVANGGGQYYWAQQNVCQGEQCQNGACNSAFPAECG